MYVKLSNMYVCSAWHVRTVCTNGCVHSAVVLENALQYCMPHTSCQTDRNPPGRFEAHFEFTNVLWIRYVLISFGR